MPVTPTPATHVPRHRWAQRRDGSLTVIVECAGMETLSVEAGIEAGRLCVAADAARVSGEQFRYELDVELYKEVDETTVKTAIVGGEVRIRVQKTAADAKWPRLARAGKHSQERVDWDLTEDSELESEEEDEAAPPSGRRMPPPEFQARANGNAPMTREDEMNLEAIRRRLAAPLDDELNPFEGVQRLWTAVRTHVTWWDLVLFQVALVHVAMAPFTKVEESFNTQAVHDLLFNPLHWSQADHHEFPGVVPRTFTGPAVLALLMAPVRVAMALVSAPHVVALYMMRVVLALVSVGGLAWVRASVAHVFGATTSHAFVLVSAVQFHLLFYLSRTLPNIFALVFVSLALGFWLRRNVQACLVSLVAGGILFRSELVLLYLPIAGLSIARGHAKPLHVLWWSIVTALAVLVVSVPFDSALWGRLVWPEGEVFYFNVVRNQSHLWGTQPAHWYVTNALPRMLLGTAALVPVGLYYDRARLAPLLLPAAFMVAMFSLLPHKETRFIFYTLPFLNTAAAVGLARLHIGRARRPLLHLAAVGCLVASAAASLLFLYISANNYPGGWAAQALVDHAQADVANYPLDTADPLNVHVDVASCMSGISRFSQPQPPLFRVSKQEDESNVDWASFDYLIRADLDSLPDAESQWEVVRSIDAYAGISRAPPFVRLEPRMHVLKRRKAL